jgi:2-iminoacetate synthase
MFTLPPFSELQESLSACCERDVTAALQAPRMDLRHLTALLSPAADDYLPQLAAQSRSITLERFGKTTQLYGPIYLSNYCTNRCVYCGFSAKNSIPRRCLTVDEAEQEADILLSRGFNHILLVSGEAERILGVDYLEELTLRLRHKFAAISIEVQPLSTAEYKRLFDVGITAVAIYQETYNPKLYQEIHLSGKKRDYDFRLETPARVCEAGLREVGLGTLLGLSDWRAEALAMGHHLHWLRKKYWKTAMTVSFPRLRPAAGQFEPRVHVTERDLSHLIFALRLFDHDVGLILSTREESRFRDGMLGLGPTRYSAGSCTAPGGYGEPEDTTGEQFSVGDNRSLDEVSKVIQAKGFDPVCKDWDPTFQPVINE